MCALLSGTSAGAEAETDTEDAQGIVRVGMVVLGDEGVTGSDLDVCFSEAFLATLARETDIPVHRALERTRLTSDELFDYPFLVLAGQGAFTLGDEQRERLEAYIDRGGFVLASAGCSNAPWAASFERVSEAIFGEEALEPITTKHALFHTVYDIEHIDVRGNNGQEGQRAILAREVDGIVRLIFSPVGLNATDSAGGGCCCCGSNEIRNARLINTNILAYALTQ